MKIILIVSCCAELLVQTVGTNKDDCHDTLSIVLTSIMILWAYSYIVPCDDLSIHVCHMNWILWNDLHYINVCVEPCDDVYCVRTVCCLPAQVRVLCIIYQCTSLQCTHQYKYCVHFALGGSPSPPYVKQQECPFHTAHWTSGIWVSTKIITTA